MSEIEKAVRDGHLYPGQRLPSVRALAADLRISPSTVAAAFSELRRRGIVITQDRGATRINDRPPVGSLSPAVYVPPGVRDLATGNPDPLLLPDLAAAITSAFAAAPGQATAPRLYGADDTLSALREFAADGLRRAASGWPANSSTGPGLPGDGVESAADAHASPGVSPGSDPGTALSSGLDAVVVSGALDGIERTLSVVTSPGAKVAIEDPGYDSLLGLVRALGLVPVPVAVDEHGPRPGDVRHALAVGATVLVVTCRAQNPTGAAIGADRAAELRTVLNSHPDVLLVENDHLGDVAGAPLHTLVGVNRRWVHVRSFAKALGPDLRVAVLLGDPETIDRVRGRQALGPGWVSEVLQRTTLALLGDPHTTALLNRARITYQDRRRSVLDALAARDLPATGSSGFNVWVPVADETTAVTTLLNDGWAVAPGARYRQTARPGIRITTSDLQPDEAEHITDLLAGVARPRSRRTA